MVDIKGISEKVKKAAEVAQSKGGDVLNAAKEGAKVVQFKSGDVLNVTKEGAKVVLSKGGDVLDLAKGGALKTKDAIINTIDENGNGEIDIEDVIIKGLKVPGIRIKRSEFLRKEFFKLYPEEVINDAIAFNPSHAGISREDVDEVANEVIKFERNCVSGISAALSAPGGVAMVATIPADIAQYYGYMLRAAQKLMYL